MMSFAGHGRCVVGQSARLHNSALVPRAQLFCVSDILAGLLIYGIQRNRGLPACCAADCAGCVPIYVILASTLGRPLCTHVIRRTPNNFECA
jgi:hypothetical protein